MRELCNFCIFRILRLLSNTVSYVFVNSCSNESENRNLLAPQAFHNFNRNCKWKENVMFHTLIKGKSFNLLFSEQCSFLFNTICWGFFFAIICVTQPFCRL